jgi:hypothetical protein
MPPGFRIVDIRRNIEARLEVPDVDVGAVVDVRHTVGNGKEN